MVDQSAQQYQKTQTKQTNKQHKHNTSVTEMKAKEYRWVLSKKTSVVRAVLM